jgi:hypothetical protein
MMHTKVYTLGLLVTLNFRVKSGSASAAQSYNSDATVSNPDDIDLESAKAHVTDGELSHFR